MYDDSTYRSPMIVNGRSGNEVVEANFKISDLKNQLAEMEVKIQVLYSILRDKGISPETFEAKIEEIMKGKTENPPAQKQLRTCPECGKAVKPSADNPLLGRCMFCGAKVPYYPSFE